MSSRYLEPGLETMPRPELLKLQERRLLDALPLFYEKSAVTREAWQRAGVKPSDIRSLEDFRRRVPFLDKDGLRDFRSRHGDPFCGQLTRPVGELNFIGSSSGTTGDPTLLPAASAGGTFMHSEMKGAFQGMMHAITPYGSGTMYSKCSAGMRATTWPSILSAQPA